MEYRDVDAPGIWGCSVLDPVDKSLHESNYRDGTAGARKATGTGAGVDDRNGHNGIAGRDEVPILWTALRHNLHRVRGPRRGIKRVLTLQRSGVCSVCEALRSRC